MEILATLSKKNNSIVKLVKISGKEYVIKYYPKYSRSMYIELNILATCNHPNIIKLEFLLPATNTDPIGIVMNNEKKNLMDVILKNKYTHLDTIKFALQISKALQYIHHNQIVHLDLKTDNVMLSNGICKIIDFGASEYRLEDKIRTTQIKCTTTHRAPEGFIKNKNKYVLDYSFDIWSFGIILLELLLRVPIYMSNFAPIYNSKKKQNIYDNEMYEFFRSDIFCSKMISILPTELMPCLELNPELRPNINYVCEYLTNIYKFLIIPDKELISDPKLALNYVSQQLSKNFTGTCGKNAIFYHNFLGKIAKLGPDHMQKYSQPVIYATFDLIHRLSFILGDLLTSNHINEIIIICSEFLTNPPNLENYIDLDYYDPSIINDIIIASKGILFQFHYYVHNCDPPKVAFNSLLTTDYLEKSLKLIEKIK